MSIAAVVLAAGAGTRMGGQAKALLTLEGMTFVQRIADTARAAGVEQVAVVAGPPFGSAVRSRLPLGAGLVWNPDPSRGMLSSVQAAIGNLSSRTHAALIWPVDLPRVRTETVRLLLAAPAGKLAVPRLTLAAGARGGHPIRLPRALFGKLLALAGDDTLRALFDDDTFYVDVDDPGIASDIDTPADYAAAQAAMAAAVSPEPAAPEPEPAAPAELPPALAAPAPRRRTKPPAP